MRLLIQNGRVLDPVSGLDEVCDVYVDEGRVAKIGRDLGSGEAGREAGGEDGRDLGGSDARRGNGDGGAADADVRRIDASGCWVMPGLIDLHVHLRDPGQTYKEDIATGGAAAARGGFTTILAMPNTKPPIDTPDKWNYVRFKAAAVSPVHVLQIGAMTMGQKGEKMADLEGMADAGAPAFSEDGRSVMNAALARRIFRKAAQLGIPVFDHCEDANLAGGVVHDDENADRLHLPGIPSATEDIIAARDILLAKDTGVHLHLCHISTKDSVEFLRLAKRAGVQVSGEVCPHHFTLTSDDIPSDDPNYKMNPPVRSKEDREALREGLRDGTIDCIATDHAPHSAQEKSGSMRTAPFGIVGLETAVPLAVTELVETGLLTPLQLANAMSTRPAQIANLHGMEGAGRIAEGLPADLTIVDPAEEYRIDSRTFASKGRNTPFNGRTVRGRVRYTIVDGEVVWEYRKGARHD